MATQFNAEDLQLLTGFADVLYVAAGGTTKATIEGASAGVLVRLGPGTHSIGANVIAIPADVTVRGAGRDATRIVSSSSANVIVKPGSRSVTEHLTIECTGSPAIAFGVHGSDAVFVHAAIRDCRIINVFDGGINVLSTQGACSLTIQNVLVECLLEGVSFTGAGHTGTLIDVVITSSLPLVSGSSASIIGSRVKGYCGVYESATGLGALGTSSVVLFDSYFASDTALLQASVNVAAGARVVLANCEYDRSATTGTTANIIDIFSPLRPTAAGRTLDVTTTGAGGIDWSNVENPTTTQELTGTTMATTGAGSATVANQEKLLKIAQANSDRGR